MVRTVQGNMVQEQCQARRVAFWESALVIHQLLGTVHSDLLKLIVDRVQPPPPCARMTAPAPYSPPLLELRCASRVPPAWPPPSSAVVAAEGTHR